MERLNFANKKLIAEFFIFLVAALITCMIPVRGWMPHNISALSYITIIIMWALTIRRRIIKDEVRHRILIACIFMALLFVFRMSKFSFFRGADILLEQIWYMYYIPMTAIPLFFFMAALWVEPAGDPVRTKKLERMLIILEVVIAGIVLTNSFHSMVFKITVHPDKEYTRGWFYFVVLTWIIIFGAGTLYLLFAKCSISAVRKLWYIPAICIAGGMVLLFWYLIVGGAPKIAGYKLFQLQEAFCFPFIAGYESIILIGMCPANSGYERLFDSSVISACIYDSSGRPRLSGIEWEQMGDDDDHRIRRESVSGGYVTWIEDLSAINRLNSEIEDITEELEDENELIRQENEVRAERVSYETKNRLYNRIATAVRTRAVSVNELLNREMEDEVKFHDNLVYALVLSAYIKRMGNLMLITDGVRKISSGELKLAIGESVDYIRLGEVVCDIQGQTDREVESALLLLAYELFECAIEDVWTRLNSLLVRFDSGERFSMTIALDSRAEVISPEWKDKEIQSAGGKLFVEYEDDTYYIRLEEAV